MLSHFSHVQLFVTPWTVAPTMKFPRQEYWSGLPYPLSRDLPTWGLNLSPASPALQVNSISTESIFNKLVFKVYVI